jgi:hypothetical protein
MIAAAFEHLEARAALTGLQTGHVNGRTVLPLTRQPSGLQAWKPSIPATQTEPEPRVHEGTRGASGCMSSPDRMRLVLGVDDLELTASGLLSSTPGLLHWFGSTGGQCAEVPQVCSAARVSACTCVPSLGDTECPWP